MDIFEDYSALNHFRVMNGINVSNTNAVSQYLDEKKKEKEQREDMIVNASHLIALLPDYISKELKIKCIDKLNEMSNMELKTFIARIKTRTNKVLVLQSMNTI